MNWRKAYLEAANLIEEKGWCQGALRTQGGAHCVLGALIEASPSFDLKPLQALIGDSVAIWNDKPERTKEEIIAALRKAAED